MVADVHSKNHSRGWEFATLGALIAAAVAIAFGYLQYQKVQQLSTALESANGREAQVKQQLASVNDHARQLEQQLAQQASAIQRQFATIEAEAKPDLPLSVGFRHAVLANGLVMELRNNSSVELQVAVIVSSSATGLGQQKPVALPPNRIVELGPPLWSIAAGDRVQFRNINFRPRELRVP